MDELLRAQDRIAGATARRRFLASSTAAFLAGPLLSRVAGLRLLVIVAVLFKY